MRRTLGAGLLLASVALVLACSGVDALPAGGDAGTMEGGSLGPTAPDASVTIAPNGCALESTGFVSGTKADNALRPAAPNAVSWKDVDSALTEDGRFATVTLDEGQDSAALRVSGFDLRVPEGKDTYGIEVELKRRAPEGGVEDRQIELEIEGKQSRFKYMGSPWPTSIVGTHVYGQAVDTWGVDLYPTDVNKASFAATVSVKRAAGATGPVTANVESLRVAVHYCR